MTSLFPKSASPDLSSQPFIDVYSLVDGVLDTSARTVLPVIHPGDEGQVAQLHESTASTVLRAVASANATFVRGDWSAVSTERRQEILLRLADRIETHAAELGLLDSEDMGKPITLAIAETQSSASRLRQYAYAVSQLGGSVFQASRRCLSYASWQPLGVVAAITPWNYPAPNTLEKIAPALALGNSVVLKPSEIATRSSIRIAQLAIEAGIPSGALHVVVGRGATVGTELARHLDVAMLTFTGSTAVGRSILKYSGESNGKRVAIECGGKSPQIVFEDIGELHEVVPYLVADAMANTGQLCSAKSRLLVQRSILPTLLDLLLAECESLKFTSPRKAETTYGPIAFRRQYERVIAAVASATAEDSKVFEGRLPESGGGLFVAPSVFLCSNPSSALVQEEVFGPVLAVQAFDTTREAIDLANHTRYGLSASVWTRDGARAREVGYALRAGDVTVYSNPHFTTEALSNHSTEPMKDSGFGVEGGTAGLATYGTWKSISFRD